MRSHEIISLSKVEMMPTGDIKYTNPYDGSNIFLSPLGQELQNRVGILDYLDLDWKTIPENAFIGLSCAGFVTREIKTFGGQITDIAIKRVLASPESVTAVEQFQATRFLQREGVMCAEPLAANRRILVSIWALGTPIHTLYQERQAYSSALLKVVGKLTTAGIWQPWWLLDDAINNLLVVNPNDPDVLRKILLLDPICHRHSDTSKSWSPEEIKTDKRIINEIKTEYW